MNRPTALSLSIEECRAEDWLGAAQRWHRSAHLSRSSEPHIERCDLSFATRSRKSLWVMLAISCLGLCLI